MSDMHMGVARHCETVLPNRDCPYLRLGCLGCTLKPVLLPMRWAEAIMWPLPAMTPGELDAKNKQILIRLTEEIAEIRLGADDPKPLPSPRDEIERRLAALGVKRLQ